MPELKVPVGTKISAHDYTGGVRAFVWEEKYDEGIELPAGFSSWEEVRNNALSPISERGVKKFVRSNRKS